jgi:hypothetical protein
MSERPPKTQGGSATRERVELPKHLGAAQVDANGIRHVRFPLSGNAQEDQARLQVYADRGYEIYKGKDDLYVDLEIPQSEFLRLEKADQEKARTMAKPKRPQRDPEDGSVQSETAVNLGVISASDILGGVDNAPSIDDVAS